MKFYVFGFICLPIGGLWRTEAVCNFACPASLHSWLSRALFLPSSLFARPTSVMLATKLGHFTGARCGGAAGSPDRGGGKQGLRGVALLMSATAGAPFICPEKGRATFPAPRPMYPVDTALRITRASYSLPVNFCFIHVHKKKPVILIVYECGL